MTLVEQRDAIVALIAACFALSVSRASRYHARHPIAPTEVYASLLGRGIYLASIRTAYRVLGPLIPTFPPLMAGRSTPERQTAR